MAVVLRSSCDLLYLPDHGFVGEEGAIKVLLQINRQIRRLDVSHNLLGSDGIGILVQGLNSLRMRYSSTDIGLWGLSHINLANNSISDEAFAQIMGYAKKDVFMRRLLVQGNDIELRHHLESVIHCLNSSRIEILSLNSNAALLPSSLIQLFRTISSPHLSKVHLSACKIGPELAKPIISFLTSPRSRNIEELELNGNHLGLEAVTGIVDAVEHSNFTVKQIGLLSNQQKDSSSLLDSEPSSSRRQEERSLDYQVHDRLPPLLERNRVLTRRVRRAAFRIIAPARILLNARPLNDEETAHEVIDSVANGDSSSKFRLLDLPTEIMHNIVRHCSRDPTALSEAQFARLRAEAEDREGMTRTRDVLRDRLVKADADQVGQVVFDVREEWLRRGKWDRWELDRPVEVLTDDETEESHPETQRRVSGRSDVSSTSR